MEKEALLSDNETSDCINNRQVNVKRVPLGAWLFGYFPIVNLCPKISYKTLILILTFLCYMNYHLTRKAFSVVKSVLAPNCSNDSSNHNHSFSLLWDENSYNSDDKHCAGWPPFNNSDHGQTLLGSVDYSWLFAYAIAMFFSGIIADRTDLRYFLTIGMIGSGIGTGLLGIAYFANIHHLYYFIIVQIFSGVMQSTGWPGVVAVMGNWFGKQGRGFLMGVWNSHTSVGNILGTLIPAIWAQPGKNWAWSFLVPAFIMIGMGIIIFFFLVAEPAHVGLPDPKHHLDEETHQTGSTQTGTVSSRHGSYPPISNSSEQTTPLLSSDEDEQKNGMKSSISGIFKSVSPVRIIMGNKEEGAIGFVGALKIRGVLEYAFSLFFSKLVAYTFLFWLPFYVKNTSIGGHILSNKNANFLSTAFDVGGIGGGILAGGISDIIKGRAITCTVMLYLSVPALYSYRHYGSVNVATSIVLLLIAGLFVNGPYACITTAVSNDLGTHKSLKGNQKAKATVSAIIDGTGSIGAALGPLLAGWISDDYGWDKVFYLLMASCFFSALLLTRLVVTELRMYWRYFRSSRVYNLYILKSS